MFKQLTTAAALLAFAAPLALTPLAASAQNVPSYAQPADDAQIRGRVVSFDRAYALSVRDDRGFVDNVQLHEGTIINPTGLTLAPGMVVSILGYNRGPFFAANEIDTPYTYADGGIPYYGGHPWNYYGPAISLGFFFGSPGWWHGGYFGGGYRYAGGVRIYNSVRVRNVYATHVAAGTFHGRSYVAPRAAGGYHASGHARR